MPDGEAPPQPWWKYWGLFDKGRRRGQVDPLEAVRRRISRRLLEEGPEIPPSPAEIVAQGRPVGTFRDPAQQAAHLAAQQRYDAAQAQVRAQQALSMQQAEATAHGGLRAFLGQPEEPKAPSVLERARQGFQLRPSLETLKAVGAFGRALVPEKLGGTQQPFTPYQLRQMSVPEQIAMATLGVPFTGVMPSLLQARAAFTPGAARLGRRGVSEAVAPVSGRAALKVAGIPQVKGAAPKTLQKVASIQSTAASGEPRIQEFYIQHFDTLTVSEQQSLLEGYRTAVEKLPAKDRWVLRYGANGEVLPGFGRPGPRVSIMEDIAEDVRRAEQYQFQAKTAFEPGFETEVNAAAHAKVERQISAMHERQAQQEAERLAREQAHEAYNEAIRPLETTKGLKRRQVEITVRREGKDVKVPIEAYDVEPNAPLVVNRVYRASGEPSTKWDITHLPTGFTIGRQYEARSSAVRDARALLRLGDWTVSQEQLTKGMAPRAKVLLQAIERSELPPELRSVFISRPLAETARPTAKVRLLRAAERKAEGAVSAAVPEAAAPAAEAAAVTPKVTPRTRPRVTKPVAPPAGQVEAIRWEQGIERPFAFDPNSTANQGRFRLAPPESIQKGSYITRQSTTPGVSYIVGKDAAGKEVIQAIRFNKAQFTEAQAAQWWEANKGRFPFAQGPAREIPPVTPPSEAITPPVEPSIAQPPVQPPGGRPPTATGGPPAGALPPDDALIAKTVEAIKGAGPVRERAAIEVSKERAKRAGIVRSVLQKYEGPGARSRAFGALKGEILGEEERLALQGQFQPLGELLSPAEAEQLQRILQQTLKDEPYQWATAQKALEKVLQYGAIPTEGELAILERVFGPELVEAIWSKRPWGQQALDVFLELWNVPKTIKSGFEISHLLRQGALALWTGKPWLSQFKGLVAGLKNAEGRQAFYNALRQRKYFDLAVDSGVDFTIPTGVRTVVGREELFAGGRFARRIPILGKGIEWSEETYTAMANQLRYEMFDQMALATEGRNLPRSYYRNLAKNINILSGRASFGSFNRLSLAVNGIFWAPRFTVSRVLTPLLPLSPRNWNRPMLTYIAKTLGSYVATTTTMLAALDFFGVADVELDPRSSDFGKLRIGKTRIDPWAGLQQPVRYAVQILTGERKSIATGEIQKVDPVETLARFGESKFTPSLSPFLALRRGKTFVGEKISAWQAVKDWALPLFWADFAEAIQEYGPSGGLRAAPGFFGVGVQTFPTVPGEAGGALPGFRSPGGGGRRKSPELVPVR